MTGSESERLRTPAPALHQYTKDIMATTALHVHEATPDLRAMSQAPPDPDIQTTLSDFLTYTEHFPSLLTRALTLISDQRARSEDHVKTIHDATTQYAILPTLTGEGRPDPVKLRADISHALEEAERASRMAVEEAARLDRHAGLESRRLDMIVRKLRSLPMPPSRDPTPEAVPVSPNTARRIEARPARHIASGQSQSAMKARTRKILVPGEVLPPPDPNAPSLESISSWTSPRASPSPEPIPLPRQKSRTPRPPKNTEKTRVPAEKAEKKPWAPKRVGTNAHSALAGISTSNALLALTQPPEDAVKGSKWLPWTKLTEWEMAKLRKRMKKNAIWRPSLTMVKRELKNLGRGVSMREEARVDLGDKFIDENDASDPTKVEVSGEESRQMDVLLGEQHYEEDEDADAALINRGMRLNEAKKLKRQRMLEEQAQVTAQLEAEADPNAKKRKREATPSRPIVATTAETPDPLSRPGPPPKKLRLAAPQLPPVRIPLAPAGISSSPRSARPPTPVQRPKITLKTSKAASAEPPNRRASLRRGSNASLPSSTKALTSPIRVEPPKGNNRRSKRPAPGLVTADEDSAKVGVSRRKSAPKKKQTTATATAPKPIEEIVPEEYVDPNEPRYCICGDVSWGTMIACDNDDCEKEWFHLSCVGLSELPPRRTKWFCPDCRKRLKLGQSSNGLVGKVGGGR